MRKKQKFIHLLFCGQFLLLLLALVMESFKGHIGIIKFLLLLGPFFLFYKLMGKALRMFYYTYWTLSVLLLFYTLNGLWSNIGRGGHQDLFLVYFVVFLIICLQSYLVSSPLFYPRVNWWEYDFRFREDWPVRVKKSENYFDGRLTDLRRGAGCIVLFQDFCVGEEVTVCKQGDTRTLKLKCEVVSKREYSYGRGVTYGVRFLLSDNAEKRIFNEMMMDWKQNRKEKIKLKFSEKSGERI